MFNVNANKRVIEEEGKKTHRSYSDAPTIQITFLINN